LSIAGVIAFKMMKLRLNIISVPASENILDISCFNIKLTFVSSFVHRSLNKKKAPSTKITTRLKILAIAVRRIEPIIVQPITVATKPRSI